MRIKDGHFTEEQWYKGEPRSDRRSPVGNMPFPYPCVIVRRLTMSVPQRSASLITVGQLEVVGRLQYPFGVSLQVAFNFGGDLHIFNQYE